MKQTLKFLLLSITIVLFQINLFGQNKTIDSLKLALKNAKHDTTRCNILNAMVEAEGDHNIWPKYNEQLKVLVEKSIASNASPKKLYLKHLAIALN
ncbi:hypothetical protein MEO39_27175, partial [Dolichospermum sp. ST_sed2]|nr:hypothetical protein [Dolichospermum sp. ST_sed2]